MTYLWYNLGDIGGEVMAQDNDELVRIKRKTTETGEIKFNTVPDEQTGENRTLLNQQPIERVEAKGFDPNLQRDSSQTLPTDFATSRRPALDSKNHVMPGAGAAPQPIERPIDSHESAPDIGKDYGESRDPGYNGYRNDGIQRPQGVESTEGVPTGDNGVNMGVPTSPVLPGQGTGLNKKDGLKKEEAKKNKKEQQDGSQEQGTLGGTETGEGESRTSSEEPTTGGTKRKEAGKTELNPEAPSPVSKQRENQDINGYGALKRPQKPGSFENDATARSRRNFEHTRFMQQGESSEDQAASRGQSGIPRPRINRGNIHDSEGGLSGLGAKLRNGLRALGKGKTNDEISEGGKGGKSTSQSFTDNIRRVGAFLARHPYAAIATGVVILILLILIISESDGGSWKRGIHCTYNLKGVSSSGEVKLEGLQVELINCDGKASNYTVLETVDFEKYVLGVALAEIGPTSPDEAIKAQIIAARGFALKRNSGMCPGNQDGCFYGYNASTGKIRMRACEADQVYWDYDKNIYRQERGAISIYSPEINSGTLWKSALSDDRKAHVLALADEVKGKVLIDSGDNVISTNYVASVSRQFIEKANEGKDYEQILREVYTDSAGFSDGECTSYGNIDYGDYVLSSDGHEILHQPIDSFLRSKGTTLEEFNALIESNVNQAGYGTRAGVVAAAVTLIAELGNNYGVKVPYYWGGGHFDGVVVGALDTWGTTKCHTYANNTSYNYCGLDCSGFVSWAVKNGGFNIGPTTNYAVNLQGVRKVTLSNKPVMQPGDLLESKGHVVLIIGVEESTGNYVCAEASGNSSGVLFTRRPFKSSGYWGVDMEGFYETHVRSK